MRFADAWIEECNYLSDPRTRATDRTGPVVFYEQVEHGEEVAHNLPTKWEVCDLCHGEGMHVRPGVDASGFDSDDWEEQEAYFNGAYDQLCNQCGGKRVMRVVDEGSCDPKVLAKYNEYLADEAAFERQCLAERRMGA